MNLSDKAIIFLVQLRSIKHNHKQVCTYYRDTFEKNNAKKQIFQWASLKPVTPAFSV